MKTNRILQFLALLFIGITAKAQPGINYKAIINDANGEALENTSVTVQFTILENGTTNVFQETHSPTTDANGILIVNIGDGTPLSGDFNTIDWGSNPHFLKTQIDAGDGLTDMGTTEFKAVPYALHAEDAATQESVNLLFEKIQRLEILAGIEEPIIDIDGNTYETRRIGTQVWMTENLLTTRFNNGSEILPVANTEDWINLTSPGYCWYNNDSVTYAQTYGSLYNWYAVETGNLCPENWHVPTDAEWTQLMDFLGGILVAGGKLKEIGTTHWISPNTMATNESGFTALPGGFRSYSGTFNSMGTEAYWWTATEINADASWYRLIFYDTDQVYVDIESKRVGLSVRCVRD